MGNRWYLGTGEQSDIVVSTRIRLARNINRGFLNIRKQVLQGLPYAFLNRRPTTRAVCP